MFWDFLGFSGLFLDCFWSPGRMPWGLLPIFSGAFPKECPGAWHPFLVEAFKKMPRGLAPISCGGLPEKRPGAWHPIRSRSQVGISKWNLWICCMQHMHKLLYVAFSWKYVAFMEQHLNYTIPKLGPQGFLGSTFSGHLLLEVASWLPKKRPFFYFFSRISFWIFFWFFWIFLYFFGLFLVSKKDALGPFTHF